VKARGISARCTITGRRSSALSVDKWVRLVRLLWEDTVSKPIEVERIIIVDDETRGTRAGIFIAQALNHANHHREQVCAILTGLGIEPPDIQAWEYAWTTGRIWDLPEAEPSTQ
jgi:uncharacterized damage-inducible protein DinB